LSSIQELDKPLPEATTASLEALRAFSLGEQQRARGRTRDAMPFYTRAIEFDPEFALAYARLSLLHANMYQFAQAARYAAQAFERVDRVSERERFYILEAYHQFVSLDVEEHRNTIQLWVQTYPRDGRAVQRLALFHIARGECEAGLAYAREQMRLQPDAFAYGTITLANQCLGRFEEARAIAERAIEEQVDLPYLRILLYRVAFALGDAATMERQVDWAAGQPTEHLMRREQALAAASLGQLGLARALLQDAVEIAQANEIVEHAALITASAAFIEAITDHRDRARKRAAMALRISRNEAALFWAGLALGLARAPEARKLVDELPQGQYPALPVPWAVAAAELGERPDRTLDALRRSARYEPVDGSVSQYLRGEAYLELGAPTDAAREFRKLADRAFGASGHPHSLDDWRPLLRAVAHARLGRAHAQAGEFDEAREAYRRFFDLWRDADPEVALLMAAQADYAALPPPPTAR
jgi:eukaryotic-like serine/threonine-protein kinase